MSACRTRVGEMTSVILAGPAVSYFMGELVAPIVEKLPYVGSVVEWTRIANEYSHHVVGTAMSGVGARIFSTWETGASVVGKIAAHVTAAAAITAVDYVLENYHLYPEDPQQKMFSKMTLTASVTTMLAKTLEFGGVKIKEALEKRSFFSHPKKTNLKLSLLEDEEKSPEINQKSPKNIN